MRLGEDPRKKAAYDFRKDCEIKRKDDKRRVQISSAESASSDEEEKYSRKVGKKSTRYQAQSSRRRQAVRVVPSVEVMVRGFTSIGEGVRCA